MGGHIQLASRAGQGTTTRIILPLTLAILDGMSVASNESIDITFDNANNVTWWNFRIKDSSGKIWNWEKNKYNLTQISELTYYYNGSKGSIRYK